MMLRVRERGDEVHIDIDGLAGRQLRVLQALSECQRHACDHADVPSTLADVSVRAGANAMRIRLKGHDGLRFEATAIYRCLRDALMDRGLPGAASHPAP